jgi:hypothetical protein
MAAAQGFPSGIEGHLGNRQGALFVANASTGAAAPLANHRSQAQSPTYGLPVPRRLANCPTDCARSRARHGPGRSVVFAAGHSDRRCLVVRPACAIA